MNEPTSMWSEQTRCSQPRRVRWPRIRRTFEPMPSMSAPIETSRRHRSWTCGSQAAFRIVVSPAARTAAMIAFSVPVTEASSRNSSVPRSPPSAQIR